MSELFDKLIESGLFVVLIFTIVIYISPEDVSDTFKTCVIIPFLCGCVVFIVGVFGKIWIKEAK